MRIQPRWNIPLRLHFLPSALDKIIDKGDIAALTTSHLPPKHNHLGFIDHSRMPLEPSRVVQYIFAQPLPFKPIAFVLQLQPVEIREDAPIDVVASLDVHVGAVDGGDVVGARLDVLAEDFELHPTLVHLLLHWVYGDFQFGLRAGRRLLLCSHQEVLYLDWNITVKIGYH
jgi:hypothetical protein